MMQRYWSVGLTTPEYKLEQLKRGGKSYCFIWLELQSLTITDLYRLQRCGHTKWHHCDKLRKPDANEVFHGRLSLLSKAWQWVRAWPRLSRHLRRTAQEHKSEWAPSSQPARQLSNRQLNWVKHRPVLEHHPQSSPKRPRWRNCNQRHSYLPACSVQIVHLTTNFCCLAMPLGRS